MGQRAWKAVEQVSPGSRIGFAEAALHQTLHEFVIDKSTFVKHLLDYLAQRCGVTDGVAQHFASADVSNPVVRRKSRTLRSLTRTLPAK